jgi:glycerol-3-phosphate acyltransferase PlsY
MDTFYIAVGIVLAYLAGSIPTSVWIGKIFYGIDVRNEGSGNAGATNTIRVLGIKAGLPVMLFDVFKGWFAIYLSHYFMPASFSPDQIILYKIGLGISAVIGHVYPVFAQFRGGKGIATLLGTGIALYPYPILVVLGLFIMVLVITHYVSVSSMAAAISFPLVVVFIFNQQSVPLILLSIFVALFVPFTHRTNINRLINGTESKFSLKKKPKKK